MGDIFILKSVHDEEQQTQQQDDIDDVNDKLIGFKGIGNQIITHLALDYWLDRLHKIEGVFP